MDPKRCSLYARCSTAPTKGQDVSNQLTPLRQIAHDRGFQIVHEFCDEGVSGAKERRGGLDAMLASAKKGEFKTLLVMEISRLARDVRHLLNLLHELERIGVSVISIREGFEFDSVMGKAMVAMIGILVSVERELLRERDQERPPHQETSRRPNRPTVALWSSHRYYRRRSGPGTGFACSGGLYSGCCKAGWHSQVHRTEDIRCADNPA